MGPPGRLEVVHRGVYALNAALLTREGRWLAAVLAIGPDAVLSHRSAAAFWRIRTDAPCNSRRHNHLKAAAARGVLLHCLPFASDEVMIEHGIPVTTPARTLLDLASVDDAPRRYSGR